MSGTGRWPVQQQRQCMLRDHQFFVGRYDVDRNTAVGTGYQARVAGILGLVERHTKPSELTGDLSPDAHRVFADTGCKDESVEALQRGRKHAGGEAYPIDEIIDRQLRFGIFAGLQLTHIVADARESLQSTVAVEEILCV